MRHLKYKRPNRHTECYDVFVNTTQKNNVIVGNTDVSSGNKGMVKYYGYLIMFTVSNFVSLHLFCHM